MNLFLQKNNKYFFFIQFSTIVYITNEFNFVKKWIQKLNSYFPDFEQVKKMSVILLTLCYWHKNVISHFADFELLVDRLFFRWLLLTFLLFCKFHLKWLPINWTFKVGPWFRANKPYLLAVCYFICLITESYSLR